MQRQVWVWCVHCWRVDDSFQSALLYLQHRWGPVGGHPSLLSLIQFIPCFLPSHVSHFHFPHFCCSETRLLDATEILQFVICDCADTSKLSLISKFAVLLIDNSEQLVAYRLVPSPGKAVPFSRFWNPCFARKMWLNCDWKSPSLIWKCQLRGRGRRNLLEAVLRLVIEAPAGLLLTFQTLLLLVGRILLRGSGLFKWNEIWFLTWIDPACRWTAAG